MKAQASIKKHVAKKHVGLSVSQARQSLMSVKTAARAKSGSSVHKVLAGSAHGLRASAASGAVTLHVLRWPDL